MEIKAFLQPVSVNLHMIGNPWANYNVYLSTIMIPGILFLFYFLITAYSIGTELKFNRAHEWMRMADNNIFVAIAGKTIPQFMVFFTVFMCFSWYIYGYLGFPHPGGIGKIVLLALLTVLAAQGFGIFALRAHAESANVNEYMLLVGSCGILRGRSHLPCIRYGLDD